MVANSWVVPRDDPAYPHECDYHGWDGPCRKPCRADDRYVTRDGRTLFLCANHRYTRRRPCTAYVDRIERVAVTWGGGEG